MAGKEWYDAEKNIFITKGSNVANVIASSGLMGGSVRRAYEPGVRGLTFQQSLSRTICSQSAGVPQ